MDLSSASNPSPLCWTPVGSQLVSEIPDPLLTDRPSLVHSEVFVLRLFEAFCVKLRPPNQKLFNCQTTVNVDKDGEKQQQQQQQVQKESICWSMKEIWIADFSILPCWKSKLDSMLDTLSSDGTETNTALEKHFTGCQSRRKQILPAADTSVATYLTLNLWELWSFQFWFRESYRVVVVLLCGDVETSAAAANGQEVGRNNHNAYSSSHENKSAR